MILIEFLASTPGRLLRGAVGSLLVIIGVFALNNSVGALIASVGLLPLLAAVNDVCFIAPLVGMSFDGRVIRANSEYQHQNDFKKA